MKNKPKTKKTIKLDKYEESILQAYENDKFIDVPLTKKKKLEYSQYAKAQLQKIKG